MFVDSHCHLNFPELQSELAGVLDRMARNQVSHALCVATSLEKCPEVLALARTYTNLYASVGVHPSEQECEEPTPGRLAQLSQSPKVVAIGETGLDYHWNKGDNEWQRERFRVHIRAARSASKPLIVHTREAAGDTISIMREEGAGEAGGVMHCFTETLETAQRAMDLGFYISISGIVTFKNAAQVREVASAVPLDRLLIETDSPYLAPVPHRGKTNEPSFVRHVAEEIARLRNITVHEVAAVTTENFQRLFKVWLEPKP
ncbi:MAG: TatD family deoxyribonuclease [Betaproteobacteria bacterium]|nr:TatD family deoxyribonuclease [Betaproteobacteria bacterium]